MAVLTKEGLRKLQEELDDLQTNQRAEVVQEIETAKGFGDLSENAEYSAAREKQSRIEGRILELQEMIEHAELIETGGEGGVANVPRKAVLALGLDDRTVMQDAKAGSLAHAAPKLCTMRSMLFGGPPENLLTDPVPGEGTDFLVLSTEEGRLGASAICYPEMTERIGQIVGGDYFVLPSSIHEDLIMPDNGQMTPMEMAKMVKEINDHEVSPQDLLCSRVLRFHADTQELSVAADAERRREMER